MPGLINKPLRSNSNGQNIRNNAELAISIARGANDLYDKGRVFWNNHFAYTVAISEKDSLYFEVHNWIIDALPSEKIRSLKVSSSRISNEISSTKDSSAENTKPLILQFNESIARKMNLFGHTVSVSIEIPEISESSYRELIPAKIVFIASSHAGQQAVIRQLEELNANRMSSRKAVLRMVGQWNGWTTRSDLPPRTMASVSLPEEQKTRIIEDLDFFLKAEDQYNRLAIPWHRGYMFYGPPGTGKTSLVKALANEFNLDLWYISLSDLSAESSLLTLLADVGPRSLLLLEDIDTMRITHDRDSEQGKISMSSLLNTLDGVATPHGLITVMTTNRFEILDSALTRAGRMDMIEKLDYPTYTTLSNMFKHFYGVLPKWGNVGGLHIPIEGVSTSQIAEIMKRHLNSHRDALAAIKIALKEAKL